MKNQAIFKLVVNSNILNDLQTHIGDFIKQSLKFYPALGSVVDLSFRVSYTNASGNIIYTLVHVVLSPKKNLNTIKIAESIMHKLNNRKIDTSVIKSLHVHLMYE